MLNVEASILPAVILRIARSNANGIHGPMLLMENGDILGGRGEDDLDPVIDVGRGVITVRLEDLSRDALLGRGVDDSGGRDLSLSMSYPNGMFRGDINRQRIVVAVCI